MEWKKVGKNKKLILILLGLFCVQMWLFFYHTHQTHSNWEQIYGVSYNEYHQKSEATYIENFHSTITNVVHQADNMGSISIFAQEDSFSRHNVEKTKADYTTLLSIKPILFDNLFLSDFFADTTRNLMGVLMISLITFVYIDENKQGLRCMIFSTVNGRGRLILQKILALLLWALCFALVLGGGNLLISCLSYGKNIGDYIHYPIQSLSMFGNFPWNCSIGTFLFLYLLYQGFVLFLIGLGIWSILFCVEYLLLSIGIVGAIGITTYFLYELIDSKHPLNVLHYCNPWYLSNGSSVFTEYKNLNIFGQAVNKNIAILFFFLLIILFFVVMTLSVGIWRYPCASTVNKVKRMIKNTEIQIQKTIDTWLSRRSLTGMEYYKVLIGQKGIWIMLALCAIFLFQADFTDISFSARQEMYFDFMEKYEGLPSEASQREIEDLEQLLTEIETSYLMALEAHENDEISIEEYIFHVSRYENFEQERQFLKEIQQQRDHIFALKERGISAWYVNCYSYNRLLREGSLFVNLLLVFGTILLTSGVFVSEKKSGMIPILCSSLLGREDLLRKKFQVAYVLTLCLFFVISFLEFATIGIIYGFGGWMAPVQSILQLAVFPIPCNIFMFFLGLYLLKAMVLLMVATVCGSMFTRAIS